MAGGVELDIEVLGDQIVRRRLLRFAENVDDARPAFLNIASLLSDETERRFRSEGVVGGGGRWAPLMPATIRDRIRQGYDTGPILNRSGRLFFSLVGFGAEHIEEIGRDEMRWGSRVPYGKFHQHGTRHMVARPPVRLSERTKRSVVRELQRAIVEGA